MSAATGSPVLSVFCQLPNRHRFLLLTCTEEPHAELIHQELQTCLPTRRGGQLFRPHARRRADRFFATTIRLRSEGTDHLLAAAEAIGVSHVVAQGFGAFNGIREGGWVKTEEDPLDPGPAGAREGAEALRHLEDVVAQGWWRGPALRQLVRAGRLDDWAALVRKRQFPLVGRGTGYL